MRASSAETRSAVEKPTGSPSSLQATSSTDRSATGFSYSRT